MHRVKIVTTLILSCLLPFIVACHHSDSRSCINSSSRQLSQIAYTNPQSHPEAKHSQVMIEAVLIEMNPSQSGTFGMQWVDGASNRKGSNRNFASGILNTARQVGSLVGVALFGTIANLSISLNLGIQYALICASSIFLLGVGLIILCRDKFTLSSKTSAKQLNV